MSEIREKGSINFKDGWYPLGIVYKNNIPYVYLKKLDISNKQSTENTKTPFFANEFSENDESCFLALDEIDLDTDLPISRPVHFIYHLSRCGSTLATQMLKHVPDIRVFSEPLGLAQLFSAPEASSNEQIISRLKIIIRIFDLATPPEYDHLVIKWGSWIALCWQLINDTIKPSSNCFIWRDPLEVASSILKVEPRWFDKRELSDIFDRYAVDFKPTNVAADSESLSLLLSASLKSACDMPDDTLILNYKDIPKSIIEELCPHFGFELSAEIKKKMLKTSKFDAKDESTVLFQADSEQKQESAPNDVKYFIKKYVTEYAKQLS